MKLPSRYSGAHRRRAGSSETAQPSGARLVSHEASEPASVVVEALTVTFGEVTALHEVSCEAGAGSMLAVTGPSGAGKSTLLWAMAGALEPGRTTHGTVTLDEVPVVSRDQTARAGVTMIPQGSGLAAVLTAHENCLVPLLELGVAATEARLRIEAALDAVGLTDSGNHLIEELSGGQQQRVAVARALATQPRVLLADEPTSELDHANRERILDLIEALATDGCTVVMATHDPEAAARAPREIHLDEGRVAQRR